MIEQNKRFSLDWRGKINDGVFICQACGAEHEIKKPDAPQWVEASATAKDGTVYWARAELSPLFVDNEFWSGHKAWVQQLAQDQAEKLAAMR